jgi:hypothetical protein
MAKDKIKKIIFFKKIKLTQKYEARITQQKRKQNKSRSSRSNNSMSNNKNEKNN